MKKKIQFLWSRLTFWKMDITEVKFITDDGVLVVHHVHPAWWGEDRVMDDALEVHLPKHYLVDSPRVEE